VARTEQERREDMVPDSDRHGTRSSATRRVSGASRGIAAVGPLLALQILLWIAVFGVGRLFHEGPNGKAMGTDFAVFSGAANALKHGQNPYDYRVLYRSERSLLTRQHLPVTKNEFNVRAGNPPLFYWALEPLTTLPFQRVALAWIVLMYLFSAMGFLLALRYLRWTSWLVPTIVFLLMPEVVTGALYGNVHGPVFAALALCLVIMNRHPALAGSVAAFGWLKPQLALPLVFVIFVFHATDRRRVAAGFMSMTGLLFGLTVVTTGLNSFAEWISGLNSWSQGLDKQPNIASLSGLYALWAPRPLQLILTLALIAGALALTGIAWRRWRQVAIVPLVSAGWLWVVWFLVSPYTHFPDLIVLAVPVLALLGRDGARVAEPRSIAVVYLALFSLALFPSPLVSLGVVALGVLLAVDARARSALWPENPTVESVATS
jgi:Glycosyltransferase family 87